MSASLCPCYRCASLREFLSLMERHPPNHCIAKDSFRDPARYLAEEQARRLDEMTRALTAQAWAVAICIFDPMWRPESIEPSNGDGDWSLCSDYWHRLADLPAPADLAAEILGVTR